MGDNRLDTLSARQLECLRLAARFETSDEIAYRFGISAKTVDTHIANAAEKLGVNGRRNAIRLVLALDQRHQEKPVSDIPPVARPMPTCTSSVPEPEGSSRLRDVSSDQPSELVIDSFRSTELKREGRTVNDLTPLQKLALIAAIALGIAVFLIAIPPMAAGFGTLANFIEPYRH